MGISKIPIQTISIETKKDFQQVVHELIKPLDPHFSAGCARLRLGYIGASYTQTGAEMEALARILWGIAPLLAGGGSTTILRKLQTGIMNGTNPDHTEYWGDLVDYDQRAVEMAPLGVSLAMCPDHFWHCFDAETQDRLSAWLYQINGIKLNDNNWLFFRVLANLGLKKVGARYDWHALEQDLARIEDYYLGQGWYSDGTAPRPPRRDYYVSFALHYYGLLYAALFGEEDPERAAVFKERAATFAHDFIYWFSADGAAIPFGRSLTYRFAQGAFWGALVYAGVATLPLGVVKGIILRHVRWWLRKPIFTETGLLTIGYGYPNLFMSEQYNSYGSPYWALKFFLPLAMADDHPFWAAAAEPLPTLDRIKVQPHPFFVICRDNTSDHVFTLAGGQYADTKLRHTAAKYSKFVYSTHFAFSVPTAQAGLSLGAFDNTLALSEEGEYFRVRDKCLEVKLEGTVHYSKWSVWKDVVVETWLVPCLPWHIRIHRINSGRQLIGAEGGFALGVLTNENIKEWHDSAVEKGTVCISTEKGVSGLVQLYGNRQGELVRAGPNSNLLEGRTIIPTLVGELCEGVNYLICAVLGSPNVDQAAEMWQLRPKSKLIDGNMQVLDGKDHSVIYSLAMNS